MKRKEYHQRLLISASVEQDRWRDFQDLCDKERKSYSMKINELIGEELEKNQVGEHTPIRIVYGNNPNKPCQMDLTQWFDTVNNITNQQELLIIKGQASHICGLADKRSMELHRQGIRK